MSYRERAQSDSTLQTQFKEREQLPVAARRTAIMDAINENPVIIIRGNTGCGKTTQVSKRNILLPA
jgi:ATP-dependent RNA helicase A